MRNRAVAPQNMIHQSVATEPATGPRGSRVDSGPAQPASSRGVAVATRIRGSR